MTAILAWGIIVTVCLAALCLLVLMPLAFIVKQINNVLESKRRSGTKTGPQSRKTASPSGLAVARKNPSDSVQQNDNSFGLWGPTIVPYTQTLALQMGQLRPMLESNSEVGLRRVIDGMLVTLDDMEANIPPPPIDEVAVHWSAMILLLRQTCAAAIEGIEVTRTLRSASRLLELASKEMVSIADAMKEWTRQFRAGEVS